MPKLHEILAAEDTVVKAANKLLGEMAAKFNKHSEYFFGSIRELRRINDSPEDVALAEAARKEKPLATTVPDEVGYTLPFLAKALDLRLQKHYANQCAISDIVLDGNTVMKDAPVDFLLDLEKELPRLRDVFLTMPTLDPSKDWVVNRKGAYRTKTAATSAQTETREVPVVLAPATDKHPAQVKMGSETRAVGVFHDHVFSGAVTTQQKADILSLCDRLIIAVKEARMRANMTEALKPHESSAKILGLFEKILEA